MWPFNRMRKPRNPQDFVIRATAAGTVDSVQTGVVVVDGVAYENLRKTLVVPGQKVKLGQPVGRL